MNFDKHVKLCDYHYRQDTEPLPQPKDSFVCLCGQPSPPPPRPSNQQSVFCTTVLDFLIYKIKFLEYFVLVNSKEANKNLVKLFFLNLRRNVYNIVRKEIPLKRLRFKLTRSFTQS